MLIDFGSRRIWQLFKLIFFDSLILMVAFIVTGVVLNCFSYLSFLYLKFFSFSFFSFWTEELNMLSLGMVMLKDRRNETASVADRSKPSVTYLKPAFSFQVWIPPWWLVLNVFLHYYTSLPWYYDGIYICKPILAVLAIATGLSWCNGWW